MKKLINILSTLILVSYIVACIVIFPPVIKAERELFKKVDCMEERIASIESQIQNIQNNYISYDDLQPVLTLFDDYQLEVDEIRNNLNDFNGLWQQMFDYKAPKYKLRGSD
jgi:regulator of replication initiation timing